MSMSERDLRAVLPYAVDLSKQSDDYHLELGAEPPRHTIMFQTGDTTWSVRRPHEERRAASISKIMHRESAFQTRRFAIADSLMGISSTHGLRTRIEKQSPDIGQETIGAEHTHRTIGGKALLFPELSVYYSREGFATRDPRILIEDQNASATIEEFLSLKTKNIILNMERSRAELMKEYDGTRESLESISGAYGNRALDGTRYIFKLNDTHLLTVHGADRESRDASGEEHEFGLDNESIFIQLQRRKYDEESGQELLPEDIAALNTSKVNGRAYTNSYLYEPLPHGAYQQSSVEMNGYQQLRMREILAELVAQADTAIPVAPRTTSEQTMSLFMGNPFEYQKILEAPSSTVDLSAIVR